MPGIQNGGVTVIPTAPIVATLDQNGHSAAALRVSSPIRIFLFFHKAIRAELDGLHRMALALATNRSGGDFKQLVEKCYFLRSIYKHHSNAEDEVFVLRDYAKDTLSLRWRSWMTSYYMDRYLKNRTF